MSAFQTVADPAAPVRIVLVGAGLMGRAWMRTIDESPDAELVGVVDLDEAFATASLATAGLTGIPVGTSLVELAARTSADAVVNVTSPAAHLPVSVEALRAGLAVLCEKPVAEICMLKNLATSTMEFCANEAMQVFGGAGYLRGSKVERIYRETKVMSIGGGSVEIMKDLAARQMGL